jgi:hypothetical protein
VFSDEFNIALLKIHPNSTILNSHILLEESSRFCVICIKNQIANKLVVVETDREELTIEKASYRSQFKTLKHVFSIRLVPWNPMGWDGIKLVFHGMIFSPHPNPFRVLTQTL